MRYTQRRPVRWTLYALIALLAQLTVASAGALADAHEPNFVGAHFDGPRQHHFAHDPETCALCIATHQSSVPVAVAFVQVVGLVRDVGGVNVVRVLPPSQSPTLQTARAPPITA